MFTSISRTESAGGPLALGVQPSCPLGNFAGCMCVPARMSPVLILYCSGKGFDAVCGNALRPTCGEFDQFFPHFFHLGVVFEFCWLQGVNGDSASRQGFHPRFVSIRDHSQSRKFYLQLHGIHQRSEWFLRPDSDCSVFPARRDDDVSRLSLSIVCR